MSGSDRLKGFRGKIDEIDDELLTLLNKRARLVLEVGKEKEGTNSSFYVPERERTIYERLKAQNRGPFPQSAVRSVFREIMSASLSLEQPLKAAFLGPKATFTHLACMKHFGLSANFIPEKDINYVFDDVERGRVDYGLSPSKTQRKGL